MIFASMKVGGSYLIKIGRQDHRGVILAKYPQTITWGWDSVRVQLFDGRKITIRADHVLCSISPKRASQPS